MTAAVLAFLVRHRALGFWAALVLAGGVASAWAVHRLDAGPLARAEARAAAAGAQADALRAQTGLDATAAAAVETARTTETRATTRSGAAADAIARLPHAQDPLDADVLAAWSAGVDGLRDEAARARVPAAPAGGAGAAQPVPPA